jgi:hypothetical protein
MQTKGRRNTPKFYHSDNLRRSGVKIAKKAASKLVRKAHELYFGCKVGDQDKVWAPRICCSSRSKTWVGGGYRKRRLCLFKAKFPKISKTKMKEGIFVGSQIKQLFEDQTSVQNQILQKYESGRHLKISAETS